MAVNRKEKENLSIENARRAKEIENKLEEKINEIPSKYIVIPYLNMDKAEFNGGNLFSRPNIIFHVNGKKIKFHLAGYNFGGRGKLPDKIFSEYENILKMALGSKLEVKS